MAWNPSAYLSFGDERTRPAVELLARISCENPARVVDLGCGPGNSTAVLATRWPKADLEGVDSSADMLNEARRSDVGAKWIEADIASWSPARPYDVIFSNATLQWLDDHRTLPPARRMWSDQSIAPRSRKARATAMSSANRFSSPSKRTIRTTRMCSS